VEEVSEKHYTVQQLAAQWGLDPDTIRPLFRDRAGVLKLVRPETKRKRGYVSLRIPESIAKQVHEELAQ